MTGKSVIPGVVASLARVACSTGAAPSDGDAITLTATKESNPGKCYIEMHRTYPANIAPQERRMTVRETGNTSAKSGGVWSLPRCRADR